MARVLIAERDEAIASLLRSLVCRITDCEVIIVHDAEAAAAALQSDTFDLVLLDIGLHSGGLQTLTRITGRNGRCEIIALTTGVIKAPLVRVLAAAEVFAIVSKPFDLAQVDDLVRQALARSTSAPSNHPLVYRGAGNAPTSE